MSSGCVCHIFEVDGRVKIHYHHTARIFLVVVAGGLYQHAAVHVIVLEQRVIRIFDFIHPRVYFLVHKVVSALVVNLNGVLNVIQYSEVDVIVYI